MNRELFLSHWMYKMEIMGNILLNIKMVYLLLIASFLLLSHVSRVAAEPVPLVSRGVINARVLCSMY